MKNNRICVACKSLSLGARARARFAKVYKFHTIFRCAPTKPPYYAARFSRASNTEILAFRVAKHFESAFRAGRFMLGARLSRHKKPCVFPIAQCPGHTTVCSISTIWGKEPQCMKVFVSQSQCEWCDRIYLIRYLCIPMALCVRRTNACVVKFLGCSRGICMYIYHIWICQ